MANRGKIPCETPGCGGTRAKGYLLCTACWRAVPRKLQRDVYSTFADWTAEQQREAVDMPALRAASAAYRRAAHVATKAACASRFPDLAEAMDKAGE